MLPPLEHPTSPRHGGHTYSSHGRMVGYAIMSERKTNQEDRSDCTLKQTFPAIPLPNFWIHFNRKVSQDCKMRGFLNVYNPLLFSCVTQDFSQCWAPKANQQCEEIAKVDKQLQVSPAPSKFAFVWLKIASFYYLLFLVNVVISLKLTCLCAHKMLFLLSF